MTTYDDSLPRWQGRVDTQLEEHTEELGDHETRLRGVERQLTILLAKIGLIVAVCALAASIAGAYLGAHGFGH
jgi:hypothetical protein